MTAHVLLDSRLFVGGADLSGSGNKIDLSEEYEAKPVTNWRSGGAVEYPDRAGLSKLAINASGQWEAGNGSFPDDALWASRRAKQPWSMSASGESDLAPGNLMWLSRMLRTKATRFGALGEVAAWSADAVGTWPLVRGLSMHASGVARTANGFGGVAQLGAVTAGRHVYANLHVLSVAGTNSPTLTVSFESSVDDEFNAPTTRGSFAAATTAGGQAIRVAGPITDQWWQLTWTITGTNPSFLFLVSMGIE
jgi:hypothetical protein